MLHWLEVIEMKGGKNGRKRATNKIRIYKTQEVLIVVSKAARPLIVPPSFFPCRHFYLTTLGNVVKGKMQAAGCLQNSHHYRQLWPSFSF